MSDTLIVNRPGRPSNSISGNRPELPGDTRETASEALRNELPHSTAECADLRVSGRALVAAQKRGYHLARYHRERADVVAKMGGKCARCGSAERLEFDKRHGCRCDECRRHVNERQQTYRRGRSAALPGQRQRGRRP